MEQDFCQRVWNVHSWWMQLLTDTNMATTSKPPCSLKQGNGMKTYRVAKMMISGTREESINIGETYLLSMAINRSFILGETSSNMGYWGIIRLCSESNIRSPNGLSFLRKINSLLYQNQCTIAVFAREQNPLFICSLHLALLWCWWMSNMWWMKIGLR